MTTSAEPTYREPSDGGERYRDRGWERDAEYDRGRNRRSERGIFISTEARPGLLTTEFWLTMFGVAALVILAFAVDELGDRFGVACATAVLVAYVLSRGIAKAGSGDMKRTSLD